ncbi:MAG: N-terminal phage integrase SAM-like domain-containing protein, partial [Xanthobacteraceae bacterium]
MRGHIRERSPGHWAIVIDLEDKAAGKRRRKWHSFKGTKRGAQNECARLVHELKSRTYVETTKETVAQFLERWLTNVRPTVSPKTFHRYQEICRRNIVPLLGTIVLAKLRPEQITAAYAKAQEIGTTAKGPLSPR